VTRDHPLVIFDAGGVLVRICRTWAQGAARAGVSAPPPGVAAPEAIEQRRSLSSVYQSGRMMAEDYFAQLAASVGCDPRIAQRIHDAWLIEEYPGVSALIAELHERNIATALLSNTNERHYREMVTPGGSYPAVAALGSWYASHELGLCKPEDAIYESVERASGRAPEQIIFFDDLADNVAAAARRGWRSRQIDHEGDTAAQMRAHLRDLHIL